MLDNLPESSFETPNNLYKDALHPGVQEMGTALQTITKTFNTLLLPLRALNDTVEIKYKKFITELSTKSESIPKENLRTPELATIGPALTDLAFSLDEESIRDMYMNLLLQSMDNRIKQPNLRAFTQIIKQLSPFEARLIKLIYSANDTQPVARIRLSCLPSLRFTGQRIIGFSFATLITNLQLDDATEDTIDLCLKNLLRLGLIELHTRQTVINPDAYNFIESSQTYQEAASLLHTVNKKTGEEYNQIDIEHFSFFLSSFGKSFCDICIRQ